MDVLKNNNTSLLAKETTLNGKEKEWREKLEGVGEFLIDGNKKLSNLVKSSDKCRHKCSGGDDINCYRVIIDTEISDIRKKQRSVECQKRKPVARPVGKEITVKKFSGADLKVHECVQNVALC